MNEPKNIEIDMNYPMFILQPERPIPSGKTKTYKKNLRRQMKVNRKRKRK